jgi:O-antigen/teichoic acid export membrane protein
MERGGGSEDGVAPLVDAAAWLLAGLVLAAGMAFLAGANYLALGLFFALVKLTLDLAMALYTGAEKVVTGGWITLTLHPFMALLSLFSIVWLGYIGAIYLFGAQILAALCALGVAIYLAPRLVSSALSLVTVPQLRWTQEHLGYLRTGVVLAVTQALIGLSTQVDILVMSAFRPPEEVAFYHAAARAALIVSIFSGMIAAVAAPTLMRQISEKDLAAQVYTVYKSSLIGFLVTIGACLGALTLGRLYLSLYGPGFDSAYPVMVVLCIAFVIFSAAGPAQMVLRAHRLDNVALWAMVAAVTLNIVLSVFLVGFLGALGVALATGTQFAVMGAAMNLACRRRIGLAIGPLAAMLSKTRVI